MNSYKQEHSYVQWLVLGACYILVVVSAIGLIYSKHITRSLHAQLQQLENERIDLGNEWTKLLLEQSTWSADGRIDAIANKQLELVTPKKNQIVTVIQ